MFRRRPILRPRRGLLGTVATTAVVAGTAAAVSGAVRGHQQAKMMENQQEAAADQAAFQSEQQIPELQAQMAAMHAQQVQASVPGGASAGDGTDMLAQLQQLAQMKEAGALTEQEFQAAKAKLLGM